ncbi:hypothetical protein BDV19DRAFT_390281 [Aspergillus venezuelensis]
MASRVSPPRRPFQAPPTLAPKASNHLSVPKYHVVDPLLGNLSPESTLQALSSTDAVPNNEKVAHDILSKSILQASPAERALGIRAAIAAQKLGQWYKEVHSWTWPKRTEAQLGKGFIPPSDAEESTYCGSLPAAVVKEHEKRIEEIRDEMDSLDVEELKEHVLNAHIPGRSRPSSANSTMSVPPPLSYVQLSDFTAVITATILRALPLLSRLNALLSSWDVRLLVLRQIPGLLHSLRFVRSEIDAALDLLKSSIPPTEKDVLYSFANYHAKRASLESTVLTAGRRMDRILDSLDGREDSLPENWIDDLESAEADFASWVMQAEKRTVENEWRRLTARPTTNKPPQSETTHPEVPQSEELDESPADAADLEPMSPSLKSVDSADMSFEHEITSAPQTRLLPLQIGRTPPMETIVEEIGSPFSRPASQAAGSISSPSVMRPRTEPQSPTPLSSNLVESREAGPVPIMQLDVVHEIPTLTPTTGMDVADTDDIEAEKATQLPLVEEQAPALEEPNIEQLIDPSAETPTEVARTAGDVDTVDNVSLSPVDESAFEQTPPLPTELVEKPFPIPDQQILMPSNEIPKELKLEKSVAQQPTPVPHVEESLPLTEGSTDEISAVWKVETVTSSDTTFSDLSVDKKPVDAIEAERPVHPTGIPTTKPLADENATSETSAISNSDSSDPTTLANEVDNSNEPQSHQPNISADVQADFVQSQERSLSVERSSQASVQDLPPQVQAHPAENSVESQQLPSNQAPVEPKPISETKAVVSADSSSPKVNQNTKPIIVRNEPTPSLATQNSDTSSMVMASSTPTEEPSVSAATDALPRSEPVEHQPITHDIATPGISAEAYTPPPPERCTTPPQDHVSSLPNLFMPHDSSKKPSERYPSEEPEQEEKHTTKKPLDSPIKLSKARPGLLDLNKDKQKARARRTSNASDGSLSDYPSLVSSPEMPEPRTSSSNATPLPLETPPQFNKNVRSSKSSRPSNDHTLREDRLVHLDAQKPSPRDVFTHNRTLSLPLQRFINESIDVNYETGSGGEDDIFSPKSSVQRRPAERRLKSRSTTTANATNRSHIQPLAPTREASSGPDSEPSSDAQPAAKKHDGKTSSRNSPNPSSSVEALKNNPTARLKKQLTTHPSLESISPYKSKGQLRNVSGTNVGKTRSRASSVNRQSNRPKDQIDEKINSILTSLPGHIHLVPADQDDDVISVSSSVPFGRDRVRSESPLGTPSRSFTPTPSLTLRPAMARRRYSHAPEESSVKLYHLHRGGKSAPTKLFVRTVGENGERVMVRVGGGWADLAEYLREYAIHHGRRHVSETPRVEVEGLSSRDSPGYSPPGSRVPSGSGRPAPARPRSVLSNRPASSLAIRKTRRSSNVSDMGNLRRPSNDALNVSFSPTSSNFPGRRLSVSSNVSAGAMSSVSEARHGSPGAPNMPLGLAGPKPRAKRSTISPESEAWVEDVLGQARRSSSLRPFKYTLPSPENDAEGNPTPTLPKSRSISDIGKAGSSKRVVIRGLR